MAEVFADPRGLRLLSYPSLRPPASSPQSNTSGDRRTGVSGIENAVLRKGERKNIESARRGSYAEKCRSQSSSARNGERGGGTLTGDSAPLDRRNRQVRRH